MCGALGTWPEISSNVRKFQQVVVIRELGIRLNGRLCFVNVISSCIFSDDDKYRKRDRYIGSGGMEFREKEGYKPEVKLEYVDDAGRTVTPKEAFRMLSHRFHGKGSGKKKTEKRMKKIEEDQVGAISGELVFSALLYYGRF
jgi:SART-1 family